MTDEEMIEWRKVYTSKGEDDKRYLELEKKYKLTSGFPHEKDYSKFKSTERARDILSYYKIISKLVDNKVEDNEILSMNYKERVAYVHLLL